MKSFDCYYAMYVHHRGLKSVIHGENLIDAIKKSNQNAIVVKVFDEDGTEYTVREHDEASPDNYYDYYWVDNDNNVLYDEREEKWGDYYRRLKLEAELEEKAKNRPSIRENELKVKVLAYNGKLLFVPNKPYEDIEKGWTPVDDKGIIGSSIIDSEKNVGISKEALEIMETIKSGGDAIGDIDWYKANDGTYIFSWLCALYRIIDPKNSVSARGFRVYKDECVIIDNDITEDMIEGYNSAEFMWKEPYSITKPELLKYKRKQKLKRIVK